MFKKIVFALFLIAALVATSASAPAIDKHHNPTFVKVFTPPWPDGQYPNFLGTPTQFKGALYLSTTMYTADPLNPLGGQIWRSSDGKSWIPVTDYGFGISHDYLSSWDTTVFKGKLYVPVNCSGAQSNCPGVILRSGNGTDWEQIPLVADPYYLDKLGEFKDMLYATSVNNPDPTSSGGQIWRSRSGDKGTWNVVDNLEPGVSSSSSPTEFKGKVYISGYSNTDSVFIWSSADGLTWQTSSLKITNDLADNWYLRDGMLTVFQGNLYLSTHNNIEGGAIYRTSDGINWKQVFQVTPSNRMVIAVEDMLPFEGDLYAAALVFDFTTYDVIEQLYRSHSGNLGTWEQITNDADWPCTFPERGAMGIFKGHLYLLDSFGCSPALYRMDGK
jgi:hypothetical protein